MRRAAILFVFTLSALPLTAVETVKRFEATYIATIKDIPSGTSIMSVWIPLPVSGDGQTIKGVTIESPYEWKQETEKEFGDLYAYTIIVNPPAGNLRVPVHFTGTRHEITQAAIADRDASKAAIRRALQPDKMVTLSPRVRKLADEVTAGRVGPIEQAHAIYDHLLATMKYDKTIPGWGKGDTERACDIRAGNCTDFHSLFMSMARAKGIPARFVIGFPMTATSGEGTVAGYHCWAEFYVKGKGWIPVDPSEASKSTDPARRAYLFGNLDPDRVHFTMGRDLKLTPRTAEPLNFFIYPHAEVNGKEIGTPSIALQYKDLPATSTSSTSMP